MIKVKEYRSKGTICVKDKSKIIYALCDLEYILYEDDTFKYIFRPRYNTIELLDSSIFQGIPGLNLDLMKEEYIRENFVPTFVAERVPQPNREDLQELLEEKGMDYMEPIEYQIRNKRRYSGDKMFMIPFVENKTVSFDDYKEQDSNNALIRRIIEELAIGNNVIINNELIDDTNRKTIYNILIKLYSRSVEANKIVKEEGIIKAKMRGTYKGRKPNKEVSAYDFFEMEDQIHSGNLDVKGASEKLGISIYTYYRLRKKYSDTIQ